MKTLKVKTPAKINLTLEIEGKRPDGFHNIQSIMQAISIFDLLAIEITDISCHCTDDNVIKLSGNSDLIPYDENNLVYKAAKKFLETAGITNKKISIYIEKNIPVAAGLAGGSSNAAGTLVGLNKLFDNLLSNEQIDEIAAGLGSDLNFCIDGGTQFATSRGEVLEKIITPDLNFIVVKPKNLFISAKEAYTKYSQVSPVRHFEPVSGSAIMRFRNEFGMTSKEISKLLNNDLEKAIINDYPQIQKLKDTLINAGCLNAMMSGSGPTVFGICDKDIPLEFIAFAINTSIKTQSGNAAEIFKARSINHGVCYE
ncbi:MAG: 4-(cytidine 5'-diphospho)-2-C-methyl-D-erythritol kinase [Candidatus Gastranaerophilaceae bacterium]|jgi:4-diphosphocytidyl-2-C-methyl-D-erythritol kinase